MQLGFFLTPLTVEKLEHGDVTFTPVVPGAGASATHGHYRVFLQLGVFWLRGPVYNGQFREKTVHTSVLFHRTISGSGTGWLAGVNNLALKHACKHQGEHVWGPGEKMAICKPGRGPHQDHSWNRDLGLPSLQNCAKQMSVVWATLSGLWCFVIAARTDWDRAFTNQLVLLSCLRNCREEIIVICSRQTLSVSAITYPDPNRSLRTKIVTSLLIAYSFWAKVKFQLHRSSQFLDSKSLERKS